MPMKILGIDPGSINCGYGLIEIPQKKTETTNRSSSAAYRYLSSGRVVMAASKPLHERLKDLFVSLSDVIADCRPDEIAVEKMFFAKGMKAALGLGHTRGVVLLAAAMAEVPIYEYSALEVKQAVAGYGRADKRQVQLMVQQILGIGHRLSPDGADALALAVCHYNMKGPLTGLVSSKKARGKSTK